LKKSEPCEPTHGAAVEAAVSATPPSDQSELSSFGSSLFIAAMHFIAAMLSGHGTTGKPYANRFIPVIFGATSSVARRLWQGTTPDLFAQPILDALITIRTDSAVGRG
jgi:hypothetical protein